MKRFFTEHINDKEKTAFLTGKELHHLKDVLRLKEGDKVIVFDGKGREFTGSLKTVTKNGGCIDIEKQLDASKESGFRIILAQSLARAEKMDIIIQKATELGVSEIIPFTASRVVLRLDSERAAKKVQRWQRIAIEAAKQCRRDVIPKIEDMATLAEVLNNYSHGIKGYIKIVPWEGEKRNNLKDILKPAGVSGCIILIGPEGGFEEQEVAIAEKAGFLPVMLGPRILRTETAAISIAAIVQYVLGDMGN
jgi:16S rRNA (uracil1498-N3)-methyltransferase